MATATHHAPGARTVDREPGPRKRPSPARKLLQLNWFGGAFSWIWLLVGMLPIYWIVITSFKT